MREEIRYRLDSIMAGETDAPSEAADFWAVVRFHFEEAAELIFEEGYRGPVTELIREGLSYADEDLLLVAEEHDSVRSMVIEVVGTMTPEELEEAADAVVKRGMERTSIGRLILSRASRVMRS